jgi:hypothetical protein
VAACLPALRPLLASALETANTFKINGLRRTVLGTAARERLYKLQDEDTKMSRLPTRSMMRGKAYGVEVSGGERSRYGGGKDFGPISKLEQSITKNDSGSEETKFPALMKGEHWMHVPPPQVERPRGILRTTEVMVSR